MIQTYTAWRECLKPGVGLAGLLFVMTWLLACQQVEALIQAM